MVLFSDMQYRGVSRNFGVGAHAPGALGNLLQRASSIQVPPGKVVVAYDARNQSITIRQSIADLRSIGWNDRITRFQVNALAVDPVPGPGGPRPPQPPPAGGYVLLAEDCYYRGRTSRLGPGSYRVHQLGIRNNSLSSFQVPQGMKLEVFDNEDLRGRPQAFTAAVSCLPPNFNDRVSAVRVSYIRQPVQPVRPQPPTPNYIATLYADLRGEGPFLNVGAGGVNTLGAGFERKVTSLYVMPGYAITVFDQPGMRGRSATFTGRVDDLRAYGWDDRIVSVYVFKR